MITIDKLEIQFDVEGDDSEVFARLFAIHIARWEQDQAGRKRGHRELASDSSLDGGSAEDNY